MFYTGKNLEEALSKVIEKHNVTLDEITYQIIEEKTGFLGLGSKVEIKAYCYKDIIESIKLYLNNYLNHLNINHTIEVTYNDNKYTVLLNSDNNAVLIGKNGQTLVSLTTLCKTHLSTTYKKYINNLFIDVNGYKEDKYIRIQKMAYRIAKEVQRTKIAAKLDPMPNDERKAIHHYLTNLPYIRTISEGEAHKRYLTIVYDENKK